MLAKITSKNQLTLPKSVTQAVGATEYVDVEVRAGQIILTPVRIQRGDAVRAKLDALGLGDADIADAVRWARSTAPEPVAGSRASSGLRCDHRRHQGQVKSQAPKMSTPLRVVLDTNVVLSALVFGGGPAGRLRLAWQQQAFVPLASSATARELVRVLAYPKFRLSVPEQEELLADYLPYAELVRIPAPAPGCQIAATLWICRSCNWPWPARRRCWYRVTGTCWCLRSNSRSSAVAVS